MKYFNNFVMFLYVIVAISGSSQSTQNANESQKSGTEQWTSQTLPTESTETTPSDDTEKCCKGYYWYSKDADKCYRFYINTVIWTRALRSCMEEGAILAVMNNTQEQKAIKELFRQQGPYPRKLPYIKESAFVGIVKRKTGVAGESGEFYNIYTNQKLNDGFAPWRKGEPNNFGGHEDCISVNYDGTIRDDPCYEPLEYICERAKIC